MGRAGITKILAILLLLMVIVLPVKAEAGEAEEEMGGVIVDLVLVRDSCGQYLSENSKGICDSMDKMDKIEADEFALDSSVFVSGDMARDSGEIVLRSNGSATRGMKFSITYDNNIYIESADESREELGRKEGQGYVEEFLAEEALRILRHAYVSCQAYLMDNPSSTCDSLALLEENGLRMHRFVEMVEVNMDLYSGFIEVANAPGDETFVIDHEGNIGRNTDKASKTVLTSDIKNAYTACMATIADDPTSTCDSLSRLERAGLRLSDSVEFVRANMYVEGGKIVLESKETDMVVEISYDGVITYSE